MAGKSKQPRKRPPRMVPKQKGRGGWRPGAGRPKGSKNRPGSKPGSTPAPKGRLVELDRIKESTPLDMMLTSARAIWSSAFRPDGRLDIDRAKEAHALAKDAAPYVHPRLSQIEGNPEKPLLPQSSADLLDRTRRMAFALRREVELLARSKRAKVIEHD